LAKVRSKLVFGLVLAFFLFCGTTVAREFTFEFHREIPVGENPTLFLSNVSGKVTIRSHSLEKVIVDALKVVKTESSEKAEEVAEKLKIEIEKDGEEVSIRTEYPKGRLLRKVSAWVNYQISVPSDTRLNVKTTSADVQIEGIAEKVRVSTVSGDLQAENVSGVVDFSSVSGDVFLTDIQADLVLEGTSSDIELEQVKGQIRIGCVSGDVGLSGTEGDVEISTTSGDIEVDQSQGRLDLYSISGDVQVKTRIKPEFEYSIETTSGDILLYLPEDSDATLECETQSGSIRAQIPLNLLSTSRNLLRGELGSGGVRINLSSVSGDIKVRGY